MHLQSFPLGVERGQIRVKVVSVWGTGTWGNVGAKSWERKSKVNRAGLFVAQISGNGEHSRRKRCSLLRLLQPSLGVGPGPQAGTGAGMNGPLIQSGTAGPTPSLVQSRLTLCALFPDK